MGWPDYFGRGAPRAFSQAPCWARCARRPRGRKPNTGAAGRRTCLPFVAFRYAPASASPTRAAPLPLRGPLPPASRRGTRFAGCTGGSLRSPPVSGAAHLGAGRADPKAGAPALRWGGGGFAPTTYRSLGLAFGRVRSLTRWRLPQPSICAARAA